MSMEVIYQLKNSTIIFNYKLQHQINSSHILALDISFKLITPKWI